MFYALVRVELMLYLLAVTEMFLFGGIFSNSLPFPFMFILKVYQSLSTLCAIHMDSLSYS